MRIVPKIPLSGGASPRGFLASSISWELLRKKAMYCLRKGECTSKPIPSTSTSHVERSADYACNFRVLLNFEEHQIVPYNVCGGIFRHAAAAAAAQRRCLSAALVDKRSTFIKLNSLKNIL